MARTGDKHELLETLNNIWDLIPYDNKPTYGEFNHLIPMGDKIPKLRELEQKDPSVGIARFGTSQEGVSVLSIIATITEKGFGDRLAVDIEEAPDGDIPNFNDLKIMGFKWYYEENPDEDRDLTSADIKK